MSQTDDVTNFIVHYHEHQAGVFKLIDPCFLIERWKRHVNF